jgi:Tfp pilus assembly protein PilX
VASSGSGKPGLSGPKGFALVIGGMLLVMLVLWGIGALVAP